jgi:hypothetical protein
MVRVSSFTLILKGIKEGTRMSIILGIMCLLFLCSSVLILSSFPISQYKKNHPINKNSYNKKKDDFSIYFDVYYE